MLYLEDVRLEKPEATEQMCTNMVTESVMLLWFRRFGCSETTQASSAMRSLFVCGTNTLVSYQIIRLLRCWCVLQ